MTRLVARVVMWLALAGVLLVAGYHFVYYLLLWEWGRAAIAGSGFAAALVLATSYVLFLRMLRIERRLDLLVIVAQQTAQQTAQGPPPPATQEEPGAEPRPDLRWLDTSTTLHALGGLALGGLALGGLALGGLAFVTAQPPDQSVFIPIFLAAGLAISAVAGGVERLAAMRQRHRRGSRGPGPAEQLPSAKEILATRSRGVLIALPVLLVLVVAATVIGLYWTTHYWSRPIGAGITTMTVDVDRKGGTPTEDIDVVEVIGRYCTVNAGTAARYVGVQEGPGGSTLLRLRPLLDEDAQSRYIGCVEDAVLEWHRLTVTRTVLDSR